MAEGRQLFSINNVLMALDKVKSSVQLILMHTMENSYVVKLFVGIYWGKILSWHQTEQLNTENPRLKFQYSSATAKPELGHHASAIENDLHEFKSG